MDILEDKFVAGEWLPPINEVVTNTPTIPPKKRKGKQKQQQQKTTTTTTQKETTSNETKNTKERSR